MDVIYSDPIYSDPITSTPVLTSSSHNKDSDQIRLLYGEGGRGQLQYCHWGLRIICDALSIALPSVFKLHVILLRLTSITSHNRNGDVILLRLTSITSHNRNGVGEIHVITVITTKNITHLLDSILNKSAY